MKKPKDIIKKRNYWHCPRCNISSNTKGRMIPCPRGGCEAILVGQTTISEITTMYITRKTLDQINDEADKRTGVKTIDISDEMMKFIGGLVKKRKNEKTSKTKKAKERR